MPALLPIFLKEPDMSYNYRQFSLILKNNGYSLKRTKGDHFIWQKDGYHITITKNPNKYICQRLIKENQLIL